MDTKTTDTKDTPAPAQDGKLTIYPNGHGGYYVKPSPSYLNAPLGATNGPDAMENAQLFADAYEAKRDTGLTPRQLAAQRAELLGVLTNARGYLEAYSLSLADRGFAAKAKDARERWEELRAILARCQGKATP